MSDMDLLPLGRILGWSPLPSILLMLCGATLSAQSLEIDLVDGRNGHPMVGSTSYVNVWVGPERKQAIAVPTDSNGIARLKLTFNTAEVNIQGILRQGGSIVIQNPVVKYDETFRINTPFALCAPSGSHYSWLKIQPFSTKQVLEQGYVSPNTCGKAAVLSKPGRITLFVRPLTWWEKLNE